MGKGCFIPSYLWFDNNNLRYTKSVHYKVVYSVLYSFPNPPQGRDTLSINQFIFLLLKKMEFFVQEKIPASSYF